MHVGEDEGIVVGALVLQLLVLATVSLDTFVLPGVLFDDLAIYLVGGHDGTGDSCSIRSSSLSKIDCSAEVLLLSVLIYSEPAPLIFSTSPFHAIAFPVKRARVKAIRITFLFIIFEVGWMLQVLRLLSMKLN
jgi:hypothetical protein